MIPASITRKGLTTHSSATRARSLTTGLLTLALLGGCATNAVNGRFVGAPEADTGEPLQGELNAGSPANLNNGARYSAHWLCAGEDPALYRFQAPFEAELALFDEQGLLLDRTDSTPGNAAGRILIGAEADQCRLVVINGEDATEFGPYRLEPQQTTELEGETLLPGQSTRGRLAAGQQGVRYNLQVEQAVKVDMQVMDATRTLGLVVSGEHFTDTARACGDSELRLTSYLEPGSYRVELVPGERPAQTGPGESCGSVLVDRGEFYHLETEASRMPEGMRNGGPLHDGDVITGVRGASQPNEYRLHIEEPSEVRIDLASNDFDTILAITGPDTQLENDDTDAGTDSALSSVLMPGAYRVQVKSYDDSETTRGGRYTLSATVQPFTGELRNGGAIEPGETVMGMRSGENNRYTLEVTEPSEVSIALDSDSFDAIVELTGNGVNLSDDDSGGGRNSLLTTLLQPGSYTIDVGSYSGSGLYHLTVEQQPMTGEMRDSGELRAGNVVYGNLASGHTLNYQLVVDAPRRVRIDAASSSVDTLLTLSGQGISLVDDDGGNNTDSRIETHLQPGTYDVEIRSYDTGNSGLIRTEVGMEASDAQP